jgi:hypothetical protein
MAKLSNTGKVTLHGQLTNIGSLQYVANNIIPTLEDNATFPFDDGSKKKGTITIETIYDPQRFPFKFKKNDSFNWQIPKERLLEVNAMFSALEGVFNNMVDHFWLLIGYIHGQNNHKIPITIVCIPEIGFAFYSKLSFDEKKMIDNNKHLLN